MLKSSGEARNMMQPGNYTNGKSYEIASSPYQRISKICLEKVVAMKGLIKLC